MYGSTSITAIESTGFPLSDVNNRIYWSASAFSPWLSGPMNMVASGSIIYLVAVVRGVLVVAARMVLTSTCGSPWILRRHLKIGARE